jgi:hypothetical protein
MIVAKNLKWKEEKKIKIEYKQIKTMIICIIVFFFCRPIDYD